MIATPDYDPVYPGVNVEYDAPIAMDDGVQLRADIYRPADAQGRTVEEKLPVIVVPTSYTKLLAAINSAIVDGVPTGTIIDSVVQAVDPVLSNSALDGVNNLLQAIPGGATQLGLGLDKRIVRQGFVQVVVDIRGQGNSPGDYVTLQDGRERRDAADLVEWARTQPWSTGHVGMVGVSYLGSTAMEAAVMKPAGLDAIVPIEPALDLGGLANEGGMVNQITGPYYTALLALRLLPPFSNILSGQYDAQWLASRIKNPLDQLGDAWRTNLGQGPGTVTGDMHFWQDRKIDMNQVRNIAAKTLLIGGWRDILVGQYADVYRSLDLPAGQKQLLIGDWTHANLSSGLGKGPGIPPIYRNLILAWFERWLKGDPNRIEEQGPVTLYQLGGSWTTT
ncbi:CocE/NonD family hydrolase, partial [Nocardia brasiliensis]|uniref:CocE/NonD family hydrolase n=1 Tax=Nocardia brasiliensis TaxID=37326 RepID=UPI003402430B